jgi:hypothetical protein
LHPQPVALTTDLPGRTVAYRVAEVRPQVNGIVLKRLFTEGLAADLRRYVRFKMTMGICRSVLVWYCAYGP